MLKRYQWHWSLVQSVLILALMAGNCWALSTDYNNGVAAYQKGDYASALEFLKRACAQDPKNAKAFFYIGLVMSQTGHYDKAREVFETVGKILPPNDPLAAKARNNMAVITQAHMTANGEGEKGKQVIAEAKNKNNYLAYAIPDGKIIHWDVAKMPVRIYITDGSNVEGWTPTYKTFVSDAMSVWQGATGNRLRFIVTNDPKKADITVHWKRNFSHGTIGVNPFISVGNTIVSSDVYVATFYSATGPKMPAAEVKETITHELGHAVGIKGHSPYPEDIMYWMANPQQTGQPTARDKNTMAALYKLEADVQNANNMSAAQTKHYFELFQKGLALEANGLKQQALSAYMQAATLNNKDPKLFVAIARCQFDQGNAPSAIQNLRKALQLDRRNVEAEYTLGCLLINEGVKYARNNQMPEAKGQFQEAVTLLQDVSASPKAPPETSQNLQIAKKNLYAIPN